MPYTRRNPTATSPVLPDAQEWDRYLADEVEPHRTSTANPHNTTKAQVGLGNVDNTTDLAKPVSTATQTALNAKAAVNQFPTTFCFFAEDNGKFLVVLNPTASNVVFDSAVLKGTGGSVTYRVAAAGAAFSGSQTALSAGSVTITVPANGGALELTPSGIGTGTSDYLALGLRRSA